MTAVRINEMRRKIVRDGKSVLRLSQAKITTAKKRLRELQRRGLSLRDMAGKLNISFQTLGRFINEKDYVPASVDVCRKLDIIADPNPYRSLPRWFVRSPEALEYVNRKRAQIKSMSDATRKKKLFFL